MMVFIFDWYYLGKKNNKKGKRNYKFERMIYVLINY